MVLNFAFVDSSIMSLIKKNSLVTDGNEMNFKIAWFFRVYPIFLSTFLAFNIFCEFWIRHSFIFIIRDRNSNVPFWNLSTAPYLVSFSLKQKKKLLPYSVHVILSAYIL